MNSQDFDDENRKPGILSELEVILHALAWPVVIGVAIGFGVLISLLPVRIDSTLKLQKRGGHVVVISQETAS